MGYIETKITAHRGDSEFYPENTLTAFSSAAEKGSDRIELDVQATVNDKLVVHHDYYLDRTSNGSGLINSVTGEYIKSLDNGNIPYLDEVFREINFDGEYEIELKGITIQFVIDVIALVKQFGLENRVEFTSPHQFLLAKLRELEPTANIGFFVPTFPDWMEISLGQYIIMSHLRLRIANVAHCAIDALTDKFVHDLQSNDYKIHVANANSEETLKRAFRLGVDQLSTDKLDLALSVKHKLIGEKQ